MSWDTKPIRPDDPTIRKARNRRLADDCPEDDPADNCDGLEANDIPEPEDND